MIPDADDDLFPHVFKVDRLYPGEQYFVADDTAPLSPYDWADLNEPAIRIEMPPLLPGEDPNSPAEKIARCAGLHYDGAASRDQKI